MTTAIYHEDLAYIHHVGFSAFARDAAPGVLRALSDAGIRDGLVVDLGCGGGIWLRELLNAGYGGLGVDSSPDFVALARAAAPGAEVVRGAGYDVALPPCAAVTAISEVLCYMAPDDPAPPPVAGLFRRVHDALRPGGLFAFDIIERAGEPMAYRTWRAGDDWAVLIEVEEDRTNHTLARDHIAFRRIDGGYRRSRGRHLQHLFTRDEIEAELHAAGFTVETGRRYGAFELPPRRLAFIARKPSA